MANPGVIGSAVIEVTVDASKIKSGMSRATETVKQETGAVADQVDNSIKKQAAAFTGTIAKIGSVIGVFTLFLNIGRQIGEMFLSNTEKAKRFLFTLNTANSSQALASINSELQTLESNLSGATNSVGGFLETLFIDRNTVGGLEERIKVLRQSATALQQFENARTRSAETKRQDAAVASIKAQADALVQAAGDGPDAIVARYAKQYRDATDLAKNARSQRERDAAAELASIVNNAMLTDLAQAKLDQQIKSLEERNKIAEEWAAIEAKAREQLEAQNAALKAQQNIVKQSSLDNTNRMVTGIDDLNQKLDAISQQMRRLQ